MVCGIRLLRHSGRVYRRDKTADQPDGGDKHRLGGGYEHCRADRSSEGRIQGDREVRRGQERDRNCVGGRFRLLLTGASGVGCGSGLEHEPGCAHGVVLLAPPERRERWTSCQRV